MSDGINIIVNSKKDKKAAEMVLRGLKALGIEIDLVQELIIQNNKLAAENAELKRQLDYNKGDGTPKATGGMSDSDFLAAIEPKETIKR